MSLYEEGLMQNRTEGEIVGGREREIVCVCMLERECVCVREREREKGNIDRER